MLEATTSYDKDTETMGLSIVSEITGAPYISVSGKSIQVMYARAEGTQAAVRIGDRDYGSSITVNVSIPFKSLKARDLEWALENLPRKVKLADDTIVLMTPSQYSEYQANRTRKVRKMGSPTRGPVIRSDPDDDE